MSRQKDQERQNSSSKASHSISPSRIAQFSPFRRGISSHSQSGDSLASDIVVVPRLGRGLGDVSDVPSLAKASAPIKPPKPVGLRVKRAKALSISLLTGNTGAALHNRGLSSDGVTSTTQKRQSKVLLPSTPPIQQQHNYEIHGDRLPSRSQSSMGFYKEYGPQMGLASPDWRDFEARDGQYSKKKRLSDGYQNEYMENTRSDELFVISKRPSAADAPVRTAEVISQPSKIKNHYDSLEREKLYSGKQRSQSSLGLNSSDYSRKPLPSPSAPAAMPFLNTYTAKAQGSPSEVKTQPRKKSAPSPLSISSSRRNSYFNEVDLCPNSAPISSVSNLQTPALQTSGSSNIHGRRKSTFTQTALTSHIPMLLPRNRTHSHAAALDYKPLSASYIASSERASSPLPPPPRHKHSKMTGNEGMMLRVPGNRLAEDSLYPRSSSPYERSGTLQTLGQQIGGIGAAVGKRGWDMMKSWNSAGPTSPLSPHPPKAPSSAPTPLNEATRMWIAAPEPASSIPTKGNAAMSPGQVRLVNQGATARGGIFGRPLREGVLLTRLTERRGKMSGSGAQLSALDLGSEFTINLPELEAERGPSIKRRVAVDREEARLQYLPAVVVRCVEAIEKWGIEEEGIYRLSGRSSHAAKLKIIFDDTNGQNADLQLVDIGPADLDLNSVCSLLKAYLRALPDLLLTSALSSEFNEAVKGACGLNAVSEMTNIGQNQEQVIRKRQEKHVPSTPEKQSHRVAKAITPLMNRLPAVNWYLLREIVYHLGDLTREETVQKTKMTLSNLCLVLAPTLSLSVAMVRMLVEAREQLFNETCPLPDRDLDDYQESKIQSPPLPIRAVKAGQSLGPSHSRETSRPFSGFDTLDDTWTAKRTSVATLKSPTEMDKRNSTSSIATLQESNLKPANEGNRILTPSVRPTSDIFSLPGYTTSVRASPAPSSMHDGTDDDDDDEDLDAPPIAAHYLRKRSSSIANSIGSTLSSSNMPYSRSIHISKASSSNSLYSNAFHAGSTMDSSVPSSADRDSPRTADDHWPSSISNKAFKGGISSSSSNASLTSLYQTPNGGALDRPRPTTPNPMRFFSS